MNKLFYLLTILALVACSQTAEQQDNTTNEIQVEAPVAEKPETNNNEAEFIGMWACDAATCGLDISLDMRADGSFTQRMGSNAKQEGTWKQLENGRLSVITENLKKAQEWEVNTVNENTWDVCWNPDSPKPKTISFKRQ